MRRGIWRARSRSDWPPGDDLVLICGASAVADRQDVGPAAIVASGGVIDYFGMPVDPGNLMLIARIGGDSGSRHARLRAFAAGQWVRLHPAHGVRPRADFARYNVARMGVGGLLREALWRPAPRLQTEPTAMDAKPNIAAVILAAGRSSRMGAHKLTLDLGGKPMLRHVVDKVWQGGFCSIAMVLGHSAEETRALFENEGIDFVVNEHFAEGLSTSLQCGVAALPEDVDGAMIFLGDMPDVEPELIARMIAAFDPANMRSIVTPMRARDGAAIRCSGPRPSSRRLIERTSAIPAPGTCSANSPIRWSRSRRATMAC